MSEQDKKHAIAAAIAIGVVILIFLIFRNKGTTVVADSAAPALQPDLGTPTYTNYNVPAYTPDLGNIIPPSQQSTWGQPGPEACGCNTSGCNDGTPGMVTSVDQFTAMMGAFSP